ncbi:MAG: hypothetical protein JXB20_01935 [Bacilli bacterium]|nr:hypothetical protein [Bacilli bacterium]MBN2697072.1 hypothetical protein [Bacilli bacterium]
MSKKKFWIFLGFYVANVILVVLAIGYWIDNKFVEILIAIYLLLITGFFSYANRRKKQ